MSQYSISEVDTAEYYKKFNVKIDKENFNENLLNEIILFELNRIREKQYNLGWLEKDSILSRAANDQAGFMVNWESATLKGPGKYKTTGRRVEYQGGSNKAEEIVSKMSIYKSTGVQTYLQLATDLSYRWYKNKKTEAIITNLGYRFAGVGSKMDEAGKKIYISCVVGNYDSWNKGQYQRSTMTLPYSKRKYWLKPYNQKECRKCGYYKNIQELQNCLFVQDNKIYFRHEDYKQLKRLIRKPKDGLAVDIIQKSQFQCDKFNNINNSYFNYGILTKRIYSKKLYKMNLVTGKRVKAIEVCLGDLPSGLSGDYELNLLIIQNKHVCLNLPQTCTPSAEVEYADQLEMLADTITITETEYSPHATSTRLTFKIPFEVNKYEYKQEDIDPFLKSLNEPDFIIDELLITAYSSIEGTEAQNRELQEKRAESIVNALKSRQKQEMITRVKKDYNWDRFLIDVKGTNYSELADMTLEEAQAYIKEKKLNKKLESILKHHRYALINMKITYDIEGDKEQAYVVKMFNNAIKQDDLPLALSIQKYIFKQVIGGRYDENAVYGQEIPEDPKAYGMETKKLWITGLLMNKLWLEHYVKEDEFDATYCSRLGDLLAIEPANAYVQYNVLYCKIMNNKLKDEREISEVQDQIEALYETVLQKEVVDRLNLKHQFNVIETLDTIPNQQDAMVVESLDRIKEIVDLKENTWQNALKLSYIFIKQEDYEFALKLIEPFVYEEKIFGELLFTYVSLCSHYPEKFHTRRFEIVIQRIHDEYPDRFCELFGKNRLTVLVFKNPVIKKMYCETCN
jgi:hypothetical protein